MEEYKKLHRYIYTTLWFKISSSLLCKIQGDQNLDFLLFDSKIEQNSISNCFYFVFPFGKVISCITKYISNFLIALTNNWRPGNWKYTFLSILQI